MEHRKLAVDLAEVVIKWELQRTKEDQEQTTEVTLGVETPQPTPSPVSIGAKRLSTSTEPTTDAKKLRHASGTVSHQLWG